MEQVNPTYYSRKGASALLAKHGLKVSPAYLTVMACRGGGPPYRKFGGRAVVYTESDLLKWAEARLSPIGGSDRPPKVVILPPVPEVVQQMFHLVRSETVPLTKKLAQEFRDMKPSPTERELDTKRSQYLEEKAKAGQLVNFQWARAQCAGELFRVNGMHSSTMLCNLNGEFPKGLKAHIDDYEVEGKHGLVMLYRQFDARRAGRSSSDIAGAYQGLVEELKDVPRATAKIGVDGYAWYTRYVIGAPIDTGDDVYDLFNRTATHPFLWWLGDLFTIKTPELRRVPIIAAMYGTFIANESAAREFWAQVSRGGPEEDDNAPSTVLDTWLRLVKEGPDKFDLKPWNFYVACVRAWNQYRAEKPMPKVNYTKGRVPPTISE